MGMPTRSRTLVSSTFITQAGAAAFFYDPTLHPVLCGGAVACQLSPQVALMGLRVGTPFCYTYMCSIAAESLLAGRL